MDSVFSEQPSNYAIERLECDQIPLRIHEGAAKPRQSLPGLRRDAHRFLRRVEIDLDAGDPASRANHLTDTLRAHLSYRT